ncbi:MAG: hypothetical protein ACOY45_02845 [Pseudomonadota bacterium]
MIARAHLLAIAGALSVAVAMPILLLRDGGQGGTAPSLAAPEQPVRLGYSAELAAVYRRAIFATAGPLGADTSADGAEGADAPADAPQLVGIAGRIDRDAVALVRTADGKTRTLKAGESVDGWRLESLAIDAAYFTRGAERARVPLPAGE